MRSCFKDLKRVFFPNLILSVNVYLILIHLLGDGGAIFENKDMSVLERGLDIHSDLTKHKS